MEFQRVDKKAKTKWRFWRFSRIMALIFVVLPLAALEVFFGASIAEDGAGTVVGWIVAGVLVVQQVLQIFLYPPIEYIQWHRFTRRAT